MFLPYCVSGVLPKVKEHYGIGNAEAGALQTIFVSSYMIVAPIFGYLGDRCIFSYICKQHLAHIRFKFLVKFYPIILGEPILKF